MKRVVLGVISLALCLSLLCGCSEEKSSCDHSVTSPATCEQNGCCLNCNYVVAPMLTHEFKDATCTEPKQCTLCGLTEGEALQHQWQAATLAAPATCTVCGLTDGVRKHPSELGFYDLEEMGNALVSITGYHLDPDGDSYVVADGRMQKFENGYHMNWSFKVEDNKYVFNIPTSPYSYEIVNNENLTTMGFDERLTVDGYDFVVFVVEGGPHNVYVDKWYVPFSMIDWDRPVEYGEDNYEYILYLNID